MALAEKQDGRIVAQAEPVACDCCGKLCTVRYFVMTNGARFGHECATVFDLTFTHTAVCPERRVEFAIFFRATKRQLAYMAAL